jgi:hypothetical protein
MKYDLKTTTVVIKQTQWTPKSSAIWPSCPLVIVTIVLQNRNAFLHIQGRAVEQTCRAAPKLFTSRDGTTSHMTRPFSSSVLTNSNLAKAQTFSRLTFRVLGSDGQPQTRVSQVITGLSIKCILQHENRIMFLSYLTWRPAGNSTFQLGT